MFKSYLASFNEILSKTTITDNSGSEIDEDQAYTVMIDKFNAVKKNKNMVYLAGNGGSNALLSHVAVDLINTGRVNAYPFTDASLLSCMANDYGYENVYRKPLEIMYRSGDALIAVSSSGSSSNIVNAAEYVREQNGFIITLSGFKDDNNLRNKGDINFWINVAHYGKVEVGHSLLLHRLTDKLGNID